MKEVEIQVEERVEFERKKVKQSFIFNDKDKNTRFLLDNRYILSNKFHDFIVKENLGGDEYQFVEEEDLKARLQRVNNAVNNDVYFAFGYHCVSDGEDIRSAMRIADERMYINKKEYYEKHPELKYR